MAVYEWGIAPDAQEAVRKVNENLQKIAELYEECAQLARENNFSFRYEGPAGYGDGGNFDPHHTHDNWGNNIDGWLASSNSC
jgi:hypothetical protein